MATQLTDLILSEVSFVTNPANHAARILLTKLNDDGQMEQREAIKEKRMNTITEIKSEPSYGIVSKCMQAIQKGDLQGLIKADFADALDELAKSYAAQNHVGFYAAYNKIVESQEASALYNGYLDAPAGSRAIAKADPPMRESEAWQRIEALARQLRTPGMTMPAAINLALAESPALYDAYLGETSPQ